MLNGYSIRKSAEKVEINIATSFYWRYKILNCISEFLGADSVDGVAIKYLNNYLKWNKWINTFSTDKETVKTKNLIVHSNIPHSYTMVKDFKRRKPIFV